MGGNSTLPILSGVYLRAADGTLELQTNNLSISIRHLVPANVEEEGETVVSGKVLTSIVKTLPDAAVSFEEADHVVTISCAKSTFRLNTLRAADGPPLGCPITVMRSSSAAYLLHTERVPSEEPSSTIMICKLQ